MFPRKKRSMTKEFGRSILANVAQSFQHTDLVGGMLVKRVALILVLDFLHHEPMYMNCLPFFGNLPVLVGNGLKSIFFAQRVLEEGGMFWKDLVLQWNKRISLHFWVVSDHCHTISWKLPNVTISIFTAFRIEFPRFFVGASSHSSCFSVRRAPFLYTIGDSISHMPPVGRLSCAYFLYTTKNFALGPGLAAKWANAKTLTT